MKWLIFIHNLFHCRFIVDYYHKKKRKKRKNWIVLIKFGFIFGSFDWHAVSIERGWAALRFATTAAAATAAAATRSIFALFLFLFSLFLWFMRHARSVHLLDFFFGLISSNNCFIFNCSIRSVVGQSVNVRLDYVSYPKMK